MMSDKTTWKLIDRIEEICDINPNKIAVAFRDERCSYRELLHFAKVVANNLKKLGVKKGDRIVFSATSKLDTIYVYLGIISIGAVAVFLDKNATVEETKNIYEQVDATLIISNKILKGYESLIIRKSIKDIVDELEDENETLSDDVFENVNETDISEILFTTGSTGVSKGCVHSYKAVYHIINNTINGVGMLEDDIVLIPLPLHHSFALRVLRATLYLGATVVLQNGFTFAMELEKNINKYNVTGITVVSASLETIRSQMQDKFLMVMKKLRYIECGASFLTGEQREYLVNNLPNTRIINTWGSTETGGCVFFDSSSIDINDEAFLSLGRVPDGIEVAFFDEDNTIVSGDINHPGRLAFKGNMCMSGYWGNAELTNKTIIGGWLLTGDRCYKDSQGYIYMMGRADELINVGGEKVAPCEIERVALDMMAVVSAACIGVADPKGIYGQVPVLYVETNDESIKDKDIRANLGKNLNNNHMPQEIHIIDAMPRNSIGKIDKKSLKLLWDSAKDNDRISKDGLSDTNSDNQVVRAILSRRSIRDFTDKPIPDGLLDMILKCGYYAPSGHNMQTWRFTVLKRREDINRLFDVTRIAADKKGVYVYGLNKPKVIVLVSNDNRNKYGCQDASCAAENMMLAAHSYGIGSVWLNPLMTLRDVNPVKSVLDDFGVPRNHTVWCMLALGYPEYAGKLLKKNDKVVNFVGE